MSSVNLSAFGGAGWQFFDNNGVPLSGGLIYSYAAGTTTPQETYTTSLGNIAHTNPIVLNSAGRIPGGATGNLCRNGRRYYDPSSDGRS